jgi:hypothetical protein
LQVVLVEELPPELTHFTACSARLRLQACPLLAVNR